MLRRGPLPTSDDRPYLSMTPSRHRPARGARPRVLTAALALYLAGLVPLGAQSPPDDPRVLLQGFFWESYRHGHTDRFSAYGDSSWYARLAARAPAIQAARFDLVWLPPPSYAGPLSAGYNPKQWFRLDNSYGSEAEHLALLRRLLAHGVEPLADIVINHRDGLEGWAHFVEPTWGTAAICRSDEAFHNPNSEVTGTPLEQRGNEEEHPEYAGHDGTTYQYPAFRDIDHTNPTVRRDVIRYLKLLQSVGYRGWRYDMVHGYHARWLAAYNRATRPSFAVGEYDWDKRPAQRGWIRRSAFAPGDLQTASRVFDFMLFFFLKDHKGQYDAWYDTGLGLGGGATDIHPWSGHAVTFVQNHDTGYRTHEDGTPQDHHLRDDFAAGRQLEQAYAYILTHPGVPTVFWKHYFGRQDDLPAKIRALVNARKVAGVHAVSTLILQHEARAAGAYAARIAGRNGPLFVRIGGDDAAWRPSAAVRTYAQGEGWKIWIGLPGNPPPRKAAVPAPLDPPPGKTLLKRQDIPDAWIRSG